MSFRSSLRRRTALRRGFTPCLAAGVLLSLAATADSALAQRTRLNTFHPAELPRDGFAVSRPATLPAGEVAVQLVGDYANDPVVWEESSGDRDSESAAIVKHHVTAHLALGWSPVERLLVHATVPVTLVQRGNDATAERVQLPPADGASLTDPALGACFRLVGDAGEPFSLALGASVSVPLARAVDEGWSYAGYNRVTGWPELLAELNLGSLRVSANGGVLIEKKQSATNVDHGSSVQYGLGFTFPDLGARGLDVHLEGFGALPLRNSFGREETELSALAGAKYHSQAGWSAGLAAGPGVLRGFGVPDARVVGMLGYAPQPALDADRDGLLDDDDECPSRPEDRDGHLDDDGCPDPDNDGDGIVDRADRCPDEPETGNGWEDEDGCPDQVPDRDGDGLQDPQDECPADPEDADGFEDEDGCPDPDNDGDGVLDVKDACVDEPGQVSAAGCPDRDGDGVADAADKCPDEAGQRDLAGCNPKVQIEGDKIELLENVYFKTGSADIEERSFDLLNNVAEVLESHGEIERVRIEGHTDARGNRRFNTRLSQKRAEAVARYLVEAGITADRLKAKGFGPTRPVVKRARTDEDHAKNRRVEFHIEARSAGAGGER